MTPKEVLDLAKKNEVKIVDIKFTDLLGTWQHFSVPTSELEESLFEDGLGFDGSSIRGWQAINNSDMIVIPDPTTAMMDPFMHVPTLSLICNISDPITKEKYSKDPRNVAQKAEAYLKSTGLGDTGYFGPEAEFFVFDDVRYQNDSNQAFYAVDSEEGIWNSGNSGRDEEPNLGYKPRHKEGYFPTSPTDSLQDIRSEMLLTMEEVGIEMECHHHEVATAGQCEIDMRFAPLVKCADNLMWYKYIVKNVAKRHGKTATFMPKPLFGDNGTGMHVHQSIWKGGKPLFAGDGYSGFSEMGLHYIGGILKHARAICAFTAPTTNSYKRLVPGFEAPVNLAYSSRNRSAAVRIPMPKQKDWKFVFPILLQTGIWLLQLCSWLDWMVLKTKLILANRWIRIYTQWVEKNLLISRLFQVHWMNRWRHLSQIMILCSKEMSLLRTLLIRGLITSVRMKWTSYVYVHTLMNSTCITMFKI